MHPMHPLKIYAYYRLLICSVFFFSIFFKLKAHVFKPTGFDVNTLLVLISYFAGYICIAFSVILYTQFAKIITQLACFATVVTDIVLLTLLALVSGGFTSEISILTLVTVSAGSIMTHSRLATSLAALASLALLFDHWYYSLHHLKPHSRDSVDTGTLGIIFFATSFLIQNIAQRLKESEQRTEKATTALKDLEALNHHIIQRMRTGILVITQELHIAMMNESAQQLLELNNDSITLPQALSHSKHQSLNQISHPLCQLTQDWQKIPSTPAQTIFKHSPQGPEIIASITHLHSPEKSNQQFILIFLEDNSRMTQHVQQLKLASLGQLTAAIAHEIRNPLGAISHAAQLLMESDTLNTEDLRLTNIIQQHSVRVNQIIENVLSLSRRKKANPERFNIVTWLKKFIADFHQPEQIQLIQPVQHDALSSALEACFDLSQLHQVILNLIKNGIRYSQKNGIEHIYLTIGSESQHHRPFINVIDFGPGISLEQESRLFEPFFTTETEGTGLGLYISRELCQANQARLNYIPNNHLNIPNLQLSPGSDTIGACFRITFAHPDKILKQ